MVNARAWIAAAFAIGLLLRAVAASRGDLWLDEAWSAMLAELAGPVGVFVAIHHDNNHPLQSLWLALVGPTAPVLLQRALAVATGTAAILVAARLGLRRSPFAGAILAWLFALSPLLVQLGSEARGYAPAILFLMLFLDSVDRFRREGRLPGGELALFAALGTLSHFVMLPGMALIGTWHLLAGGWRGGPRQALAIFAPAAIISALIVAILLGSAWKAGGMTIGGTQPFAWSGLGRGLAEVTGLATGLAAYGSTSLWVAGTVITAFALSLAWPPRPRMAMLLLGALLGLSLPLAAMVIQPPNIAFARYHLLTGLALLLLLGWRLATLPSHRASIALVLAVSAAMLAQDWEVIARAKGDPGGSVRAMIAARPEGATLLLTSPRGKAVPSLAARRRNYALRLVGPACAPADFLLAELDPGQPAPLRVRHCGRQWRTVASSPAPSPGQVGWMIAQVDRLASP